MKDFGELNERWTTCSVCGSRNHHTLEHERLNEAAPDMLTALEEAENALADYIPAMEKEGASLHYGHSVLSAVRAAIAKAKGKL